MQCSRNMEYTASKRPTIVDATAMNTETPEQVLVTRCKAGDHVAFMELIRRSSPTALRTIRAIAPTAADVEDVMQDTVVSALKGLAAFDHRAKFSTWLTRIAINNSLLLLRRHRNKIEISLDADCNEHGSRPLQLADRRIDPEQKLIHDESIEVVRRAVRALPSTLREYVEQCCLKELPHSQVASMLGISLAAGKSRSLRARRRLHSLLRRGPPALRLYVSDKYQAQERTVQTLPCSSLFQVLEPVKQIFDGTLEKGAKGS